MIVHEWTDPALIASIGRVRARGGRFLLMFHDTHHRAVSAEDEIAGMDLSGYDAVLAFGETLRQRYLAAGWGRQVVTWHEAADTRLFQPASPRTERRSDLGRQLGRRRALGRADGVSCRAGGADAPLGHGPRRALSARGAGQAGGGGHRLSRVDRQCRCARRVRPPPADDPCPARRPYVEALPGIPTIRVFEALACGIPLVSAPWDDAEGLFRPGDYLTAANGEEMARQIARLLTDADLRRTTVAAGLETIRARHTCRHRAEELLETIAGLDHPAAREAAE